jgi:CRISPR-associated protein Csb2
MPTLLFRFPARRYHATPWGHHVNEGTIEWPASPWRLLRALLATGYSAGVWNGGGPTATGRSLIGKLAGSLPRYSLPPAVGTHSRHFMPLATLDKGREKTTLVFDTWAQIDEGELAVTWDVVLTEDERVLLATLAARIGYLGRSESWVDARLLPDDGVPSDSNCFPCEDPPVLRPGYEQIPAIASLSTGEYAAWREAAVAAALADLPPLAGADVKSTKKGKRVADERAKKTAAYPEDLIACLQVETNWLRQYGWSQPPGSRSVFYWKRTDALEAGAPKPQSRQLAAPSVEAILLSLATAGENDHALPAVARVLPQAELLHRALVGVAIRQGNHSRVLSGCDEHGHPLQEQHRHAHVLPLDLNGDGHLDHFLIWAGMGLDGAAQAAIRAVRRTFTKGGGVTSLRLALAAVGALDSLRGLPGDYGDGLRSVLAWAGGATDWVSSTPFVPARYLKKNGRNTIRGQVSAELVSRGLPAPVEVRVIDPHENDRARQQRHVIRVRRHGPAPPVDLGFTIAIRFAEPVSGPIALGYGSHFGLGLFQVGKP